MKMTNEEIGSFFRDIRKARKLTLNDIASDNITVAQLSKFECGETVLSFDRLFHIIDALHLTIEEFSYAINGYENDELAKYGLQISEAYDQRDISRLQKMFDEYRNIENLTSDDRIKKIFVSTALYKLNKYSIESFQIEADDIRFVADYLMSIDEWTMYDMVLFSEIMWMMNIETVKTLAKELIYRDSFYSGILNNKQFSVVILINIYCRMILEFDRQSCRFFKNRISEMLSDYSGLVEEKIYFDFARAFEDYTFNNSQDGLYKMENIIEYAGKLELFKISSHLKSQYDSLLAQLQEKTTRYENDK